MWKFVIVQKYTYTGEKKTMYFTAGDLGFVAPIKNAKRFDTYEAAETELTTTIKVKMRRKGVFQIEKGFFID